MRWVWIMGLVLACVAVAGCRARARPALDSPDPSARLAAMVRAAERGDTRAIPGLIEALESDDPGVRLVAIATLDRLTGQTLGYRAYAPEPERRAAVDQWVRWLGEQGGMAVGAGVASEAGATNTGGAP